MALVYYEHEALHGRPNFGDDLNPWLMHALLGSAAVDSSAYAVIGVGTILNDIIEQRVSGFSKKLVFSSGAGYGSRLPRTDGSWKFFAVRGHATRTALGLGREVPVGDGAILVPELSSNGVNAGIGSGRTVFMPHVDMEFHHEVAWRRAALIAGVDYVSPGAPRQIILSRLSNARLVLTAAMHGAIVADALRTPWLALDLEGVNKFKWIDWASALEIDFSPSRIASLDLVEWGSSYQRIKRQLTALSIGVKLRSLRRQSGQLSEHATLRAAQRRLKDAAERLCDYLASGRDGGEPSGPLSR